MNNVNPIKVPAEKIRVGRDYQVIVPEYVPVNGTLLFLYIIQGNN